MKNLTPLNIGNGMTHPQVSHVGEHLVLALVIIGLLILATFLLSKYVFFRNITQHHEHDIQHHQHG